LNLKLRRKKQKLKLKVINRILYPPQYCFKPHFDFALILSAMVMLPVGQRSKQLSPKNPQISSQKSLSPGKMGGSQILQRSLLKLHNLCFFDNKKEFLDVYVALGRKQQQ